MSAEENVNVVRAWVDDINGNDVEGEVACWQPDGRYTIVATASPFKEGLQANQLLPGYR